MMFLESPALNEHFPGQELESAAVAVDDNGEDGVEAIVTILSNVQQQESTTELSSGRVLRPRRTNVDFAAGYRAVERDRQCEFYEMNRAEIVHRQKNYDEEHREEIVKKQRAYNEVHHDEIVARQRRYDSSNRIQILEKQARRRKIENSTSMSVSCDHCKALLWPGEKKGLCCNGGKVKSIDINFCTPPEPLQTPSPSTHRQEKRV